MSAQQRYVLSGRGTHSLKQQLNVLQRQINTLEQQKELLLEEIYQTDKRERQDQAAREY